MADPAKRPPLARFAATGEAWARFLGWGARTCPFFVEPILVVGYTAVFFLLCRGARRAVAANLGVLLPGTTRAGNTMRAWRVFWEFAYSMADAARSQQGQEVCDWEVEGAGNLSALTGSPGGGVLLTAHMGNYDVAAPLFSRRLGKRLNAVRAPELQAGTQEYRETQLRGQESETYSVHYNRPDNLVGIELAQALARGELVAIQGDRVVGGVSPIEIPFGGGAAIAVPRGPFVLSSVARAPVYPVFTVRVRWRTYRLILGRPITVSSARVGRDQAIAGAASQWIEQLRPVLRRFWFQWFVFEPAFLATAAATGAAAPEPAASPDRPDGATGDEEPSARDGSVPGVRDDQVRAFTPLFKLLASRRSRTEGACRREKIWVNSPGHDAAECKFLALLVLWFDTVVAALAVAGIAPVLVQSWPMLVVMLVALPPAAFLVTHVLTAVFALAGRLLGVTGPGISCALALHGRTAIALLATVGTGTGFRLLLLPWLVWAALDGAARIVLKLRRGSPAAQFPDAG